MRKTSNNIKNANFAKDNFKSLFSNPCNCGICAGKFKCKNRNKVMKTDCDVCHGTCVMDQNRDKNQNSQIPDVGDLTTDCTICGPGSNCIGYKFDCLDKMVNEMDNLAKSFKNALKNDTDCQFCRGPCKMEKKNIRNGPTKNSNCKLCNGPCVMNPCENKKLSSKAKVMFPNKVDIFDSTRSGQKTYPNSVKPKDHGLIMFNSVPDRL